MVENSARIRGRRWTEGSGELARRIGVVAGSGLAIVIAFVMMRRFILGLDYAALLHALRHTPHQAILWSVIATGLSFAALVGRDACALRYVGARPPVPAILLAGFCGTALGNAVGFGTLTGGAVRLRIYGAVGVPPDGVARMMLFIAFGFGMGLLVFGLLASLAEAVPMARLLDWPLLDLRIGCGLGLVATLALLVAALTGQVRIGRFVLPRPGVGVTVTQLALTGVDLLGAGLALWVLLPVSTVGPLAFTAIFSAAIGLSVLSHVPGGLGVFEAVVVVALGAKASPELVGAALLAYRCIYFLLPLLCSALLLAAFEVRLLTGVKAKGVSLRLARSAARLSPSFVSVMTFTAGVMLVVSGATPTFGHRLAVLSLRLPLWLVEASHFLGSLAGVVFLFAARGLLHRRDGAWWLTLVLASASLWLSLAKGLAYVEAGYLALLIILLLATRRQFGRPASMLSQPFTTGWFVAVSAIVVAAFWILHVAFADLPYTRDAWWQFEFDAEAPRALRATVGMAVFAMGLALWELLRPPKGVSLPPIPAALAQSAEIIRTQERSAAMLALMGDKSILFSDSGLAFVMFAKRGRSWIALLDPVGPRTEWPELIWRFVELADSHGGRAAFYQVRPDALPLYLDAGLKIMKLGEEARVPLDPFSLDGSRRSHLRYALKRGGRDGLTFELVPPGRSSDLFCELELVSLAWLEARRTRERGFSIARFDRQYLAAQWVGIVRQDGRMTAFASVMATSLKQEATVGVMRHVAGCSAYTMEFLFTNLLLAFRAAGYQCFSLGMVPLSGIDPAPLASRWHRVGSLIRRHGNRLYNFEGLRLFKNKFDPVWEPRYLAASGTIGPFLALADAAALVGAGQKGSVAA